MYKSSHQAYGCEIKTEKTRTNAVEDDDGRTESGDLIPFCGALLCPRTL